MHAMHIEGIDLNLATVLHALLDERSVSRAARRLGLSQSATSHALARLRHLLGDPLFVRTPRGLTPTPRAESMAAPLSQGLAAIERSFFSPPDFDPGTARASFQLGSSDYAEHVVAPSLLVHFAEVAPGIDLHMRPAPIDIAGALAQGQLDLAFVPSPTVEPIGGLLVRELWEDHFVGVARRGHPILRGKMTLDRYLGARHAFIAPRGRAGGIVDDALAKLGRSRRVAFTTPNFLVAPEIVANTDLIITLASRIARAFARTLPLSLFEPPLALPGFRIAMLWHPRHDADPAHRFLRDEIIRVSSGLEASKRKRDAR